MLATLVTQVSGSAISGDPVPYRATLATTSVTILPSRQTTGAILQCRGNLTGATGDKIFGTYFGMMTVMEQRSVIDGTPVTKGGTGSFKNATGTSNANGVQTLAGEVCTYDRQDAVDS